MLTQIQVERLQVPEDKLRCATRPEPPAVGATQRSVAWYLAELHSWGQECEARLAELREILRPSIDPMAPVE